MPNRTCSPGQEMENRVLALRYVAKIISPFDCTLMPCSWVMNLVQSPKS